MRDLTKLAYSGEPTVGTLFNLIRNESDIDYTAKAQTIDAVKSVIGYDASESDLLSEHISKLSGAGLGFLISRYFSLGLFGQIVATAAGFGIGKVIYELFKDRQQQTKWY